MPSPFRSLISFVVLPSSVSARIGLPAESTEDSGVDQARGRASAGRIPDEAAYHQSSQRPDNKSQLGRSQPLLDRKKSSNPNPSNLEDDRRLRHSKGRRSGALCCPALD
jgi:hypothetical protein